VVDNLEESLGASPILDVGLAIGAGSAKVEELAVSNEAL